MNLIHVNDGFGDIKLEQVTPETWRLIEPFSYTKDNGTVITVPAGFVTDGASSPFRILIKTWGGHYSTASVVHDYLYTSGIMSRADADLTLLEIMNKSGVNVWVKWGIWIVIRMFGGPGLKGIGVRE